MTQCLQIYRAILSLFLQNIWNHRSISTKLENGQNQTIEFVDPIYSDDQFVVVEKKENNWFMVSLSNKLYFHVIIIF